MNKLLSLILIAVLTALSPVLTGCGASLATILATIPGVVDTVLRVVEEIANFLSPQLSDADQAKLAEYTAAIRETAAILKAAADGTHKLTENEVSAAFDRLEELYMLIVAFGNKYGVVYSSDGKLSASPGTLAVPHYEDIK